jgi:hypothetical protein
LGQIVPALLLAHATARERLIAAFLTAGPDETRNYGETDAELLLGPEAEVVPARAVRRGSPTARFV